MAPSLSIEKKPDDAVLMEAYQKGFAEIVRCTRTYKFMSNDKFAHQSDCAKKSADEGVSKKTQSASRNTGPGFFIFGEDPKRMSAQAREKAFRPMKLLLDSVEDEGSRVDMMKERSRFGNTVMMAACGDGCLEAIKLLLSAVDSSETRMELLQMCDAFGKSCIMLARNKNIDVLNL